MKIAVQIILITSLTFWVVLTAVRIERLNAQSGYYLPRRDGGTDGKWRQSLQRSPRDQLRDLVGSIGILQYLFAPLAFVVGLFGAARLHSFPARTFSGLCSLLALVCLGLALYRGYFTSLGS